MRNLAKSSQYTGCKTVNKQFEYYEKVVVPFNWFTKGFGECRYVVVNMLENVTKSGH